MKRFSYVGPKEIRDAVRGDPPGTFIRAARDLEPFADGEPRTYIVDPEGALRVASRRSEHVACAGGGDVLAAGELTAVLAPAKKGVRECRIVDISNQSTGYCPAPTSWDAVAESLDNAGILRPDGFTFVAIFRRCPSCRERNLVKDGVFECALCAAELPTEWNFRTE